jgi:hypothetical protein
LVDAKYRFLWVDVDSNEAASDAQIFNNCDLKESIMDGSINFQPQERIVEGDQDLPYYIIADEAFVLRNWLMSPIQQEA